MLSDHIGFHEPLKHLVKAYSLLWETCNNLHTHRKMVYTRKHEENGKELANVSSDLRRPVYD